MSTTVDTERPPGVPDGARLVTLAELRDRIAKPEGSLRLGPRGSYLRMTMRVFPLGLRGTIRRVTGGVAEAGHRVFSLTYSTGTRTPGNWTNLVFLKPGDAERQLWVWTLEDMERERQERIAARGEPMSHTRKVCPHGITLSQCRCPALHKTVEVVRPCPRADHAGLPEHTTGRPGEGVQLPAGAPAGACSVSLDAPGASGAAEGVGPRAVKLCVFRSCDWTIAEPESLLALAGLDEEIRIHLRTHRVEIELMTEAIQ